MMFPKISTNGFAIVTTFTCCTLVLLMRNSNFNWSIINNTNNNNNADTNHFHYNESVESVQVINDDDSNNDNQQQKQYYYHHDLQDDALLLFSLSYNQKQSQKKINNKININDEKDDNDDNDNRVLDNNFLIFKEEQYSDNNDNNHESLLHLEKNPSVIDLTNGKNIQTTKKIIRRHYTTLLKQVPDATIEECQRFATAYPKDAAGRLNLYLQWKQQQKQNILLQQNINNDDSKDWNDALETAIQYHYKPSSQQKQQQQQQQDHHNVKEKETQLLPQQSNLRTRRVITTTDSNDNDTNKQFIAKTTTTTTTYDDIYTELKDQVLFTHSSSSSDMNSTTTTTTIKDSEILLLHDKYGHIILHILPARLNLQQSQYYDIYETTFLLYLTRKFLINDVTTYTMLVDVRAGSGWSNPSAISMLQFISTVSQQINTIFPFNIHNNNKVGVQQQQQQQQQHQYMNKDNDIDHYQRQQYWHRVIVFPIPNYAVYIWNALQKLLDNNILQNIILIPGISANRHATVPITELSSFINIYELHTIEHTRLLLFRNNSTTNIANGYSNVNSDANDVNDDDDNDTQPNEE